MTTPTHQRTTIDRVRERRNALRVALEALERANAAPADGNWRQRMTATLDQAAAMLAAHVAETEGPDGFFGELVRHDPRVNQHIEVLRSDHVELQRALAELIDRCSRRECSAAEMREDVLRLMGLLHRHRHAGADLLYEAYEVDIAVGD